LSFVAVHRPANVFRLSSSPDVGSRKKYNAALKAR